MRNKEKEGGVESYLLALCRHTHQHEVSTWERAGVWKCSSRTSVLKKPCEFAWEIYCTHAVFMCSYALPPHSHCYNSTLFRITAPPTVETLTNHSEWVLNLGCVRPFPRGLCCGWVHSFDSNLQRHVYGCCQSREG